MTNPLRSAFALVAILSLFGCAEPDAPEQVGKDRAKLGGVAGDCSEAYQNAFNESFAACSDPGTSFCHAWADAAGRSAELACLYPSLQ
jgi:hypothetical protein